jgi:Icc protein
VIFLIKKIIQVSDVHFGEKTFSNDLKNNLLKQIANANPDLFVLSGDLTTQGYVDEYNDAANFVDELKSIRKIITA